MRNATPGGEPRAMPLLRRLLVLALLLVAAKARAQDLHRVDFRYTPSGNPSKVAVVGSFNGWNAEANPMADPEGDGTWEASVELEAGTYTYKFLVDGTGWYADPAAAETDPDGFGAVNSVLRVGQGQAPASPYHHGPSVLYRNTLPDGRLRVRLRMPLDPEAATVELADGRTLPLAEGWSDGRYRYPEAVLPAGCRRYRFPGHTEWVEAPEAPAFRTPAWVPQAVFYQVFPERFANGDPRNDPPGTEPWGGVPKLDNFFGGDLAGIRQRLPHLQGLGIRALYLNPVFAATSNHKYDTSDYLRVDPAFGTNAELDALVAEARGRGIRVVLDGVFNHTGTGFFAFQDLLRRGGASPYRDWYFVKSFPVVMEPKPTYEAWWGYASLPKLNTANPAAREYLMDVGERWVERGAAGWRLDVPNEVPHAFWREFRQRVKAADPEAYLTGEIWSDASAWLQGDQFDGVMNYPFRAAILDLVGGKATGAQFLHAVQKVLLQYPEQSHGCLLNLLGSHDTPRIATLLDPQRRRVAEVLQFTLPGTPMVYYGDEIGMEGGKDPDCRRCFPVEGGDDSRIRQLVRLRNATQALRTGGFRPLRAEGPVFAFERAQGDQSVVVVVNPGSTAAAGGVRGVDLLTGDPLTPQTLLPPMSARILGR